MHLRAPLIHSVSAGLGSVGQGVTVAQREGWIPWPTPSQVTGALGDLQEGSPDRNSPPPAGGSRTAGRKEAGGGASGDHQS